MKILSLSIIIHIMKKDDEKMTLRKIGSNPKINLFFPAQKIYKNVRWYNILKLNDRYRKTDIRTI